MVAPLPTPTEERGEPRERGGREDGEEEEGGEKGQGRKDDKTDQKGAQGIQQQGNQDRTQSQIIPKQVSGNIEMGG